MRSLKTQSRAFTLIELLVVISIIAVLIAILLPSLGKAKQLAKTAKCGTNLRAIAMAQLTYASDWSDAIAGSPATSGSGLYANVSTGALKPGIGNGNCPNVFQAFDWMSPLGDIMNVRPSFPASDPTGATLANRAARFETMRLVKAFACPNNDFQAGPFSGGGVPFAKTGPMPSYTMAMMFLFSAGGPNDGVLNFGFSGNAFALPSGYVPRVSKMGIAANKIMIADGAKFSTTSNQPDINLAYLATLGGACADWGAFDSFSRSWDRGKAPGNGNPNGGTTDARLYSFRHGTTASAAAAGSFKLNAAFFDGHVETLDDAAGSDPSLWCPRGTTVPPSEMWKDTAARFGGGGTVVAN